MMGLSAFDRMPVIPSVMAFVIVLCQSAACLSAEGTRTKIVLIGKERDHPPRTHEYMAWCRLLGTCLEQTPGVTAVVSKGWPGDPDAFKGVDAIVLYGKHGGNVLFDPSRREQAQRLLTKGVGLTAIHWSTGAAGDEVGQLYLRTLGGWFHNSFSALKTTTLKIHQPDPRHPICRGWADYDLRDEYYLKLRFAPDIKPIMTVQADGKVYPVGWAYERADSNGGRSFGCVLGHFHEQFGLEPFRRALVNGILWTAHRDVPGAGAPCKITPKDMNLPPDARKKK